MRNEYQEHVDFRLLDDVEIDQAGQLEAMEVSQAYRAMFRFPQPGTRFQAEQLITAQDREVALAV